MASTLQNSSSSKKRRFQPPITSYFVSSTPEAEEATGLSHQNYAAPTNTPTPVLPNNILSSLLGVGARVRKAVPEGYRTEQQKMLTAYTIPANRLPSEPDLDINNTSQTSTTLYAELEPFCGIHKIGNYAVQTFPRPAEQYRNNNETVNANADDLESFSIPSSSQESNTSLSSSSLFYKKSSSNKRAYDSDVDEEDYYVSSVATTASHHNAVRSGFVSGNIWQDTTSSGPHTSIHNTSSSSYLAISQRTILSPKLGQHRRRIASAPMWKTQSEQENEDPVTLAGGGTTSSGDMMDLDDFGEAAFLRRREEVDGDYF